MNNKRCYTLDMYYIIGMFDKYHNKCYRNSMKYYIIGMYYTLDRCYRFHKTSICKYYSTSHHLNIFHMCYTFGMCSKHYNMHSKLDMFHMYNMLYNMFDTLHMFHSTYYRIDKHYRYSM